MQYISQKISQSQNLKKWIQNNLLIQKKLNNFENCVKLNQFVVLFDEIQFLGIIIFFL